MVPESVSLLTGNVKHNYGAAGLSYRAMETQGQRIRSLREAKGMSQQDVADALGVTREAVSYWESDTTQNIKYRTFVALAELLGTTTHFLAFGPREPGQQGYGEGTGKRRPAKGRG